MKPQEVTDRGRALYNTRQRTITAVRRHLVGMGTPGVGERNSGIARDIVVDGYNARVIRNLHRVFNRYGRVKTIRDWTHDDPRPWVVFDVPTYAEDPSEVMAVMSIDTFARLLRKDPT